jgi:hypothetical protein
MATAADKLMSSVFPDALSNQPTGLNGAAMPHIRDAVLQAREIGRRSGAVTLEFRVHRAV